MRQIRDSSDVVWEMEEDSYHPVRAIPAGAQAAASVGVLRQPGAKRGMIPTPQRAASTWMMRTVLRTLSTT